MLEAKVVEKIKTQILYLTNFFFENRAVYETMWKNTVEPGRPQMALCRMHIACWIPKATKTHSEYVILIALPLQQWLHERTSMLSYTYIHCLVKLQILSIQAHVLQEIFPFTVEVLVDIWIYLNIFYCLY